MFYVIEWLKYIIEEVKIYCILDIDDKVLFLVIFYMLFNVYFRVGKLMIR